MTLRNTSIDEQLAEARVRFAETRPRTAEAHAKASEHMPGGNTRTVLFHPPFPIRVAHGEGARITDLDGHTYVNLLGEYTAGVFGHSHPAIRAAIERAVAGGLNLGAHNSFEPRFAELVCERFKAMEKVRFTNSGTEANLMAISTARAITGRDKVLVFTGGYHGALLYFGSGGSPLNVPFPYVAGRYNDVAGLDALIEEQGDELACIIAEPMMGSGGCIAATPDFLRALRSAADRSGALLILDEVMTSRLHSGGVHGELGVMPDLLTLGKWVGGGSSFGAFGGRADIMDRFDPNRADALSHAGTFNNNVITMSAGIAALEEAYTPEIALELNARGDRLRESLNRIFRSAGVELQAIGLGSLMAVHGTTRPIRSVDDLKAANPAIKELLFLDLLEHGYYMADRGFIALSTAVTEDDVAGFLETVERIVADRLPVFRSEAQPAAG